MSFDVWAPLLQGNCSLEVGMVAHCCQVVQGCAIVQLVKHHHLQHPKSWHSRGMAAAAAVRLTAAGGVSAGDPRSSRVQCDCTVDIAARPGAGQQAPQPPEWRTLHSGCDCTSLMTTQLAMKPAEGRGGEDEAA